MNLSFSFIIWEFVAFFINLLNLYHKLRILSIDIVLGAVSGGIMAEKILDVEMETVWWFVLALAVWIIYTADHLIDAKKLGSGAKIKRRLFYYNNFRIILIIEIILIVLTVSVSFLFFDNIIIWFGIVLGVLIAIYLLIIQIKGSEKSLWLQKELIVALVYTVGIWGGPILYCINKIALHEIMIITLFFLIVWADILIIAQFEIENDKQDGFTSLPLIIGEKKAMQLIFLILTISVLNLLFLIFSQNTDLQIIVAAIILFTMSFLLCISVRYKNFFKRNEQYSIVAETVFLLPALMVLV